MPTILCYGDSNTHGTCPIRHMQDRRRLGRAERWPGVMAAALGPDWTVIEEGLPARTTVQPDPIEGLHKNGLAVLPAVLESHRPLDIVALMLGTNDLKARFALTTQDIAASADRLIAAVLASECGPEFGPPRVLLIAPPPVIEAGCLSEIFTGAAAKSARLGHMYAKVAERRAAAFLDAGAVIASSPVDGVHFEPEAHTALGQAVANAIRAKF
jgi:lysophospholipase L1-like esterase